MPPTINTSEQIAAASLLVDVDGMSTEEAAGDCGAPRSGWLKKAAWNGIADQWPEAWKVMQNVNFSSAQIAAASLLVDVDGLSTEEAADKWIGDNVGLIAKWKGI